MFYGGICTFVRPDWLTPFNSRDLDSSGAAGRDMILTLRNVIFAILHPGKYKEEMCNRKL